jgi:hypothetical protein
LRISGQLLQIGIHVREVKRRKNRICKADFESVLVCEFILTLAGIPSKGGFVGVQSIKKL